MIDGTRPAEHIEQVEEEKMDPLEGLQHQIDHLNGVVLSLQADDQGLDFLRQELRDSAALMQSALVVIEEMAKRVKVLEKKVAGE